MKQKPSSKVLPNASSGSSTLSSAQLLVAGSDLQSINNELFMLRRQNQILIECMKWQESSPSNYAYATAKRDLLDHVIDRFE